jgi:anti-anti-sigma factor
MEITFDKKDPDISIIHLKGDLDYHASADLREKMASFLSEKPKKILLDMSKVNYIDSSGIAAFVETSRKVKSIGSKIVFHSLTSNVKSVFELAKLHLFFQLAESEECAIQQLS